jgi:hypothetical protein
MADLSDAREELLSAEEDVVRRQEEARLAVSAAEEKLRLARTKSVLRKRPSRVTAKPSVPVAPEDRHLEQLAMCVPSSTGCKVIVANNVSRD